MFSKANFSKALGWLSAALGMYGASHPHNQYGALALALSPLVMGWANHLSVAPAPAPAK